MNDLDGHPMMRKYPSFGSGPLTVAPLVPQEYFELDREAVFRRSWLIVCREEELSQPGSYLVKDLPTLRTSDFPEKHRDEFNRLVTAFLGAA